MLIIKDIASLCQVLKKEKCEKTIGLVPTMGALHAGHLSLIKASKEENDLTVCSIFVNPKQFGSPEDLQKYPKDIERDCQVLKAAGCNIIFIPSEEEMYAHNDDVIGFSYGYLENIMEGKFRPGHFNGVGIVVLKLFNIVDPDKAYFGQKDLQQFVVINKLVNELNVNVKLRCMPIVREQDGLAMSSRNTRLSGDSRKVACIFYNALREAEELISQGKSVDTIKQAIGKLFTEQPKANLEYFEIVNAQNLLPLEESLAGTKKAVCIAGYVNGVRLIDNIII
jgi:pantoate--beta-alanine ligase